MTNWETPATGTIKPITARMVVEESRLHRDVVAVRKLFTVCEYVVNTGTITILHQCVVLHRMQRVTLNNASDYQTNGLHLTPNPNPSLLARQSLVHLI